MNYQDSFRDCVCPDTGLVIQRLKKKPIASGNFGEVTLGHLWNGITVAIKSLKNVRSRNDVRNFIREGEMMKTFRHVNVLPAIGICDCFPYSSPRIILPFMPNGDLKSFLKKGEGNLLMFDLLKFCFEIAGGMNYLSERGIVHRDLAARNCMVDSHKTIKISDFGLARNIHNRTRAGFIRDYYKQYSRGALPCKWMAPESLSYGQFDEKTDVWSFGITIWEVMNFGDEPYPKIYNDEILEYVERGGRLGRHNCPPEIYEIMMSCWEPYPEDRPTFWQQDEALNVLWRRRSFSTQYVRSRNDVRNFIREGEMMKTFRHVNVLPAIGICDCLPYSSPRIILPFMPNGDLKSFLKKIGNLFMIDLLKFCSEIAGGMNYLSERGIVHRDLAARNCMVDSHRTIKISDFGLARNIHNRTGAGFIRDYYKQYSRGALPCKWMAPESLSYGQFDEKTDVWSFGITMWEVMAFGDEPYPSISNNKILEYVERRGRLGRPINCPWEIYDEMESCWELYPEDRPTFEQLDEALNDIME